MASRFPTLYKQSSKTKTILQCISTANDAVHLLSEAKSRISQSVTNFKVFEI